MHEPGARIILKPRSYFKLEQKFGYVQYTICSTSSPIGYMKKTLKILPEGQKRGRRGDSYEVPWKHK
jgi:hypothetical protein